MYTKDYVLAVYDKNKEIRGTAFYIGNGKIVTCSHVVKMANSKIEKGDNVLLSVIDDKKKLFTGIVSDFTYYENNRSRDKSDDICVLIVEGDLNKFKICCFKKGDCSNKKIEIIGIPGEERVVYADTMTKVNEYMYQISYVHGTKFTEGFSGAPVRIRNKQYFVGMISRKEANENNAFVISTEKLIRLCPDMHIRECREKKTSILKKYIDIEFSDTSGRMNFSFGILLSILVIIAFFVVKTPWISHVIFVLFVFLYSIVCVILKMSSEKQLEKDKRSN